MVKLTVEIREGYGQIGCPILYKVREENERLREENVALREELEELKSVLALHQNCGNIG